MVGSCDRVYSECPHLSKPFKGTFASGGALPLQTNPPERLPHLMVYDLYIQYFVDQVWFLFAFERNRA